MITFLKGFVEELEEGMVHLEVQGVGYGVEVSTQTLAQLKEGLEVKLLIHHHITDSDERLFGFYTKEEKQLFEKLITVKGVGPKSGVTIVSGLPADHLIAAITSSDAASLSRVPGIGKKTAERIILELKDKLGEVKRSSAATLPAAENSMVDEVMSALESLGFKKKDAEAAAVKALQNEEVKTVASGIKQALSLLNKN